MHDSPMAFVLLASITLSACASVPEPDVIQGPKISAITRTPRNVDGAIYQQSSNQFLFEDIRARRVGDVINVVLEERTDATKTASTSSNKGSKLDMPSPTLFGSTAKLLGREVFKNSSGSGSEFRGAADSSQSNRLTGTVAVTVSRQLANGNLWIQGTKTLTLNQGSEVVKVSGQIRPVDISPDNTIRSSQIADANITYGGSGLLADANNAGWLTRFFQSPVWPF